MDAPIASRREPSPSLPLGRWVGVGLVAVVAGLWLSVPFLTSCRQDDIDCGDQTRSVFVLLMLVTPLAAVGALLVSRSLAREISAGGQPRSGWRLVAKGIRTLVVIGVVVVGLLIALAVVLAVHGFVSPDSYMGDEPDYTDATSYVVIALLCTPPALAGAHAVRRITRLLRAWSL